MNLHGNLKITLTIASALCLLLSIKAHSEADTPQQFTFAWPYTDSSQMRPRGGTTRGPAVKLQQQASAAWAQLAAPNISKFERDRRAILAMAGAYRTSFDFLETVGFVAEHQPPRPYQSWGTEYVYVVEDRGPFISLQHIIVMFIEQPNGEISEPIVVKHWRQDWQYEDRDLHVYQGNSTWQRRQLSRREARGSWSQAVFQVDDSPRYEASGRWQHLPGYSSWQSAETWRPLPRREFSVRDDYDVLVGTNRHTITPLGWVQEEDNLKVVLEENGRYRPIAKELGLARYELIIDHDFSAGDAYWQRTQPFWSDLRSAWRTIYENNNRFATKRALDGKPMFAYLFELAERLTQGSYDSVAAQSEIEALLDQFIEAADPV